MAALVERGVGLLARLRKEGVCEVTGKELRALREASGLSREALAARLGVSAQSVWRWEKAEKVRDVLVPALRAVLVGV